MEFQEYTQRVHRAAQLVETGDYAAALALLRSLLASDISDLDKAMMCVNMAVVHDRLGQAAEALGWYDEGMAYERQHAGHFVAESKAVYLAEHGQTAASLALYEELLTRTSLDEQAKERISRNLDLLRQRGSG